MAKQIYRAVSGSSSNFDSGLILGGCFNGGKVIASRGHGRNIHEPAPHGPENCVRCRWFLTDSRYLPALNAHLNFMSYKASEAASLAATLEAKIEVMNERKYGFEEQGKSFTLLNELQQLQRRYEKQTLEADEYTKDWIATFQLILRIIEIEQQRQEGETKNKLKRENHILKQNAEVIVDLRPKRAMGTTEVLPALSGVLLPTEIDALKAAISTTFFERQGWSATKSGAVKDSFGRSLFQVGFIKAIEKVLKQI